MNPMSTETQPSEHAMRAAQENDLLDHAETLLCNAICPPHCTPEEWETIIRGWRDRKHAIAPAMAERDRRIAELVETLIEYLNYSSIDGAPERRNLRAKLIVLLAKHGGAHE